MCSLQTAMEIHVACSKIALAGTVWRGSLVMVIDSVNRLREVPHSRPPRAGRSGNSRDGHHMLHGYSKFLDVDFSVQVALPVFLLPAFSGSVGECGTQEGKIGAKVRGIVALGYTQD